MFKCVEEPYFPQSFIPGANSDRQCITMLLIFLQGPDFPLSHVLEVTNLATVYTKFQRDAPISRASSRRCRQRPLVQSPAKQICTVISVPTFTSDISKILCIQKPNCSSMEGSTYLYWYKIFSQRLFFLIYTDVNHNHLSSIPSQSPQCHRLHVEHHCAEQHTIREETSIPVALAPLPSSIVGYNKGAPSFRH